VTVLHAPASTHGWHTAPLLPHWEFDSPDNWTHPETPQHPLQLPGPHPASGAGTQTPESQISGLQGAHAKPFAPHCVLVSLP
jgi:hypothetical protein